MSANTDQYLRRAAGSLIIFVMAGVSMPCAYSADALLTDATNLYKGGHYAQALAQFEKYQVQHPRDGLTHYYIGLCSQNLHQMSKAKQEYEWVSVNAAQPQLRELAKRGLTSIGSYQGHSSSESPEAKTATTTTTSSPSSSSTSSASKSSTASTATTGAADPTKLAKVIEFTMANQRQSLLFDQSFQSAKASYPKVSFEQVEASGDTATAMMEKYNITQTPSVVFLDGKGKVMESQYAAGMGDGLTGTIDRLVGKK